MFIILFFHMIYLASNSFGFCLSQEIFNFQSSCMMSFDSIEVGVKIQKESRTDETNDKIPHFVLG